MSRLLVLRFGSHAAAIVLAAFASFAVLSTGEASMETLALMLAAVGLSLLVGVPLGIAAGMVRPFPAASSRRCWTQCRSCRRSPT